MNVEEIKKEAADIESELDVEDGLDRGSKRFYKVLLGIFLAIIIIFMIVPFYGVSYNPSPKHVDRIEPYWEPTGTHFNTIYDLYDYDISPIIRQSAIKITSSACKGGDVCYARSLFYYVRDNVNYLSDPPYEYIQTPEETLLGAGDCEDKAILLAYLLKAIGIRTRIVIIPGHAYLEAYMPDAPKRYLGSEGWVSLDATCSGCDFGILPIGAKESIRRIPI